MGKGPKKGGRREVPTLWSVLDEEEAGVEENGTEDFNLTSLHTGAKSIVPVMVPVPGASAYSYGVPEGMSVEPGSIVRVPLGPRTVIGIVWDEQEPEKPVEIQKLRPISEVFNLRPISKDIRRFVDWVARYTLTSPGLVAKMVVRLPSALHKDPPLQGFVFTGSHPAKMTSARKRVLDLMADGLAWSKSGIATAAGVSASVIEGLARAGALRPTDLPPKPVADRLIADFANVDLSPAQEKIASKLRNAVADNRFSVSLVDGVTGSGKTEVYFEAISKAIEEERQVLVLVPEISLTGAFLDRFHARFGGRPTEWHSDITPKQREKIWRGVSNGKVRVVVGARSALFLPFENLGLIIVDEEHDMAYKQEDRAIYNARDMAVVRGHLAGFAVVLASATPSLESYVNAKEGRYQLLSLPGRFQQAELPDITAIDMRDKGPEKGQWLASSLIESLSQTLAEKKQSLLFLNRRGYAPLTLCRLCGFRFQCPDCSTWLVEHRFRGTIECHHCGHTQRKPETCPNCDGEDSLVACGPGVERIFEEIQDRLPQARTIVLSSDMFTSTKRLKMELAAIERGEADIIIGTQLVAKGHNFPKLALVGVVDADLGLSHGDIRAAERTFQLLLQVTGRAGRAGGKSRAFLQTYAPDHAVIQAIIAGDRDTFYEAEAAARKLAGLPPFGRLVAFIVSGKDKASAVKFAQHLRLTAPQDPRIMVLGPAEAPLAIVRGRHRVRLLIQAPKELDIQGYVRNWLEAADAPRGGVQLQVDVDPQSFW